MTGPVGTWTNIRRGIEGNLCHPEFMSGLPHDRGNLLWTAEDGASRRLLVSFDRWGEALLADDGIDMPISEGGGYIEARIISRGNGVICGAAMIDHLLQIWGPSISISWHAGDGRSVGDGDEIASISGPSEDILKIERSILNILGRLSGIATESKKWAQVAPASVACTRKTVWGILDKWAVHLGGCLTHRLNRDDAVMIKENDLASFESSHDDHGVKLQEFLEGVNVEEIQSFLEVEVQNEKEAISAAATWLSKEVEEPLVIMLDNFGVEKSKAIATELQDMGLREHVLLEGSGGIEFKDLENWRESGLDVISTSRINRGTVPLDMSMLIVAN